jgi:hypothetical protein
LFSVEAMFSMAYDLLKYRGVQIDENMPSSVFFSLHARLVEDSQKGELDPFLRKVIVKAPERTHNSLG